MCSTVVTITSAYTQQNGGAATQRLPVFVINLYLRPADYFSATRALPRSAPSGGAEQPHQP